MVLLIAILEHTGVHDIQESDDYPNCVFGLLGLVLGLTFSPFSPPQGIWRSHLVRWASDWPDLRVIYFYGGLSMLQGANVAFNLVIGGIIYHCLMGGRLECPSELAPRC